MLGGVDILRFLFPNKHTVPDLQNDSSLLLEALSKFSNILPSFVDYD